jgi:4-alpha-glucanotransferase
MTNEIGKALDASSIPPATILKACLKWLRASPAELILVNLEDLWEEKSPQNVPGTSTERPNWRRKARFTIEELITNPELHDILHPLTPKWTVNQTGGGRAGAIAGNVAG